MDCGVDVRHVNPLRESCESGLWRAPPFGGTHPTHPHIGVVPIY